MNKQNYNPEALTPSDLKPFTLFKSSTEHIIDEVLSLCSTTDKKDKKFNNIIKKLSTDYFVLNSNIKFLKNKKFNIKKLSDDSPIDIIINNFLEIDFELRKSIDFCYDSTSSNNIGFFLCKEHNNDLKTLNFDFSSKNTTLVLNHSGCFNIDEIFKKYIMDNLNYINKNYHKEFQESLSITKELKFFFDSLYQVKYPFQDIFEQDKYYNPEEIYETIYNIKEILSLTHDIQLDSFLINFKQKFLNEKLKNII